MSEPCGLTAAGFFLPTFRGRMSERFFQREGTLLKFDYIQECYYAIYSRRTDLYLPVYSG